MCPERDSSPSLCRLGAPGESKPPELLLLLVTKEDIKKSNAATVTEALQKTAGLNVKNYGGYGNNSSVYIRGMSGDAVAILVDGIQMNSAQSGEFDLSHLAIADVEKIES